ncbi:MAG: hypothetical protein K0S65_4282, partial [Labilithrix sp.]|nr:hypothetical protein [Labilithrix sp.]
MSRRAATAYQILTETPHSDLEDSGERFIERPGLSAAQLDALTAFHTNDHDHDEVAETTLTMSPEANRVLVAQTFDSFDDDVTLEAPVPEIPARTPSPLGEDDAVASRPSGVVIEPERLLLEEEIPAPLMTHEELVSRVSGPR